MSRRGMTLAECLVALVVSSALVAAVDAALLAGQRFSRAEAAARGLRQNLRAVSAVLRAELEPLAPEAGDLVRISDSSVTLRAARSWGIVCAVHAASGVVVLDDSLLSSLRSIDPAKDSAIVFAEGAALSRADDRWEVAEVAQVRRGGCADGTQGTAITFVISAGALAAVRIGAPVRVFETDEYKRYRDATGLWWLGVRTSTASGWSAMSPIAGPLAPSGGLRFRWFDASQAPTAIPDSVALAEVEIRVLDQRILRSAGKVQPQTRDSALLRVAFVRR